MARTDRGWRVGRAERGASVVDISVLGPLEVRRGDTVVPLGASKLRALLLSLVLDVGRVVPAERLIERLWADTPPPQPMVSLRSYVSNLRRLLREPGSPPVITNRAGGYFLEVTPERIDAHRFEHLAGRARELIAAGHPAEGLDLLTDALALWRGDALADVADAPYARATVTKLEELRLTATEDRSEALLATGRHLQAIPELEAFVSLHPSRERPIQQLVLALYRSGRAPDALRVAADHRRSLVDEYGLEPSAQLAQLTQRILRQDPALEAPTSEPTAVEPPTPPTPPAEPPTAPVAAPPVAESRAPHVGDTSTLVGRAHERDHLVRVLTGLTRGAGATLLFAGEPGIGKTALLDELARSAADRGIATAWGRCSEQQGAPPFWPWLTALRAVAAPLDDEALRAALRGNAALVTQLVPELAARLGRAPVVAEGDPEAARFALYDAVATFLDHAAGDHGLVVVLDDLHWADRSSLQVLALVSARAATSRLVLAASYRDTATERTSELDATLATLARERSAVTLQLRPLGRPEVRAIVEEVTGEALAEDVFAAVYRRADGNPFFVRQLAALVSEDATHDPTSIPVGVRHVLLQRMRQVPDGVRETLSRAAVLGQSFDVRVLAEAGGTRVVDVLDHIDLAIRHGLVEAGGDHASAYRFTHALVRETIYDELPPGVAARLHAAAADALELDRSPPVEAIAEHLWRAGDLAPTHRAVGYLRAAADEAVALFAHEQAEQQLHRALTLLERDPDPGTELAVRLRLVQVLTGLYGWAAGQREEVTSRVRRLAGRAGIGAELVPLWWSLWSTIMTRGDLRGSQELAAELLTEAVRTADPASLVAGHVATAYTDLFAGADTDEVLARLELAAVAERGARPSDLARTPEHLGVSRRVNVTMAHALSGDVAATLASGEDAVAYASRTASGFQEGYARMFAAWSAALVDRPAEARRHGDAGLELSADGKFGSLAMLHHPVNGWAAARCGADPSAEAARMTGVIDALEAAGHVHAIGHWLMLLAEVHVLGGDVPAATAALARAGTVVETTGERVYARELDRVRRLVAAADRGVAG